MLTKRISHSWQPPGIYTFGKATDDMSSNDNGTANGEAIFNPLNISSQHGLSDFDVSRRLTLYSLWAFPSPFQEGIGKTPPGRLAGSGNQGFSNWMPFPASTNP